MGDVHAMSSGIQCPRSCAGYSAATGTLVGWGGAADCEAVVVPHAQSDQAVASSTMACMRFVRRKRFMDPTLQRPCWRIQASMIMGRGERKSVVSGKSVSVRVDLGGRRILQQTKHHET